MQSTEWQIFSQICSIAAIFVSVILTWVLQRYGKKQDQQDVKISALEQAIARFDERTTSYQRYLDEYKNILEQTDKKVERQTSQLNEIKGQLDTLFVLRKYDRRSGGDRRKHNRLEREDNDEN